MQFRFTDEQTMIRDTALTAAERLADQYPVHKAIAAGEVFRPEVWSVLSEELGFCGLAVDEAHGGSALGQVEMACVMEALGYRLTPAPFFASACLAANLISLAGSDEQKLTYLPGLADGSVIGTWAHGAGGAGHTVTLSGEGVLNGAAAHVLFGHVAGLLAVSAETPAGPRAAIVRADAPGVTVTRRTSLDLTQPVSDVRFENVRAEAVLDGGEDAMHAALDRARVALAAEQLGGAQAALDLTAAYAKERIQFGRPIGSFQAIKHRLADMMTEVEAARSAVYYAACTADEDPGNLAEAAAVALGYASGAYFKCAGDMIQLHGGIGFTWEHAAHLYFKRARASSSMLGERGAHFDRLADIVFERGEV